MALQRADRLKEPPVVGSLYLVPTVLASWHGCTDAWPVIGPAHTDIEFFDFKAEHYHIDGRFLSKKQRAVAEDYAPWRSMAGEIQAAPLHALNLEPLPRPVFARRKCWTSDLPYEHGEKNPIRDLRAHFAGHKCEQGKGGYICPHRKASLGSVLIVDGVITCPLHGLRIDASSGMVLPNAPVPA